MAPRPVVVLLYLVFFFFWCLSLFWELQDNGVVKNVQFRPILKALKSLAVMLELFIYRTWAIPICNFPSSKARLIAKISFKNESDWHENNKIIFIIKASNLASLLNRRLGQLGNGLITKNFLKQLYCWNSMPQRRQKMTCSILFNFLRPCKVGLHFAIVFTILTYLLLGPVYMEWRNPV